MDLLNKKFIKQQIQINYVLLWMITCLITTVTSSDGRVFPPGRISKNVGDDINITCSIDLNNKDGKNSSNLWFYDNSKREVPHESIAIINASSIVLMIKNATEMDQLYTCKEDGKLGIDYSHVLVGTPPKAVEDFDCKSYDFEYFICKFTPPHNNVNVQYNLSYVIQSQIYDCSLQRGKYGEFYCNMSMENNTYRQVHDFYIFTLIGTNVLGELKQNFEINHFDSVIPAKPELKIINKTSNSVTFEWQILKSLYVSAKKRWEYDTKIMPLIEHKSWIQIDMNNTKKINKNTYRLELTDLKYAYTWYDIRMRMKVKTAKNDGTMWSETFNTTFRTLAKKPDIPPRTDVGSFCCNNNIGKNLNLYWEILPQYKENGPNLHYEITEIRQDGKVVNNIKPYEITLTSATFKGLIIADYEFIIKSVNTMGSSDTGSIIKVPRLYYPQPEWLRKVYHQQKYTLSWSAPKNRNDLIDYTVFWCASKTESSDQCEGSINFKHVDKNTRNITYEEKGNSTMNFAVSANYLSGSSGMLWAMCTALKDSDFGKMNPMLALHGSTTINVQWSLECLYATILEGYHLIYCPINKPDTPDPNCTEPEKNVTISKDSRQYDLINLKPYTTYKVIMSMYSSEKQGPQSDPKFLTTVETASSPPRRLGFRNLTNNSVTLTWTAPEYLNGKLRYYEIIYNNDKIRVEGEELLNSKEITYKLDRLRSFYDYKVYVIAFTVEHSDPSNDIHFKTLVGVPGSIEKVRSTSIDSEVAFEWDPPTVPSGRLDFYEVRSLFLKNNDPVIDKISFINGTKCRLKLPACPDNSHSYQFYVRAINIGEKETDDLLTRNKRGSSSDIEKFIDIEQLEKDLNVTPRLAVISKRHSNAEIGKIDYNEQEIIHNENRIRHNRQERENQKGQYVHISHRPLEIDDISSFMCEEDNDTILKKWIDNQHKQGNKFLRAEWSNLPSYVCNYKSDIKRKLILICGVIFSIGAMIVLTYFGCQKYRKMKNIAIRFPPGLTDLDQEIRPKGTDNIIGKNDITRSEESLFKNENHYLLASSGNDSGYLHGIDFSDKSDGYDISSEHIRDDEHSSAQSDSVEMSDISNSSNTSPSQSPNVNVRDNKVHNIIKQPSTTTQITTTTTATAATTTAPATPAGPLIVNGYVQHQAFQKPPSPPEQNLNGYTTLDAFGKPIISPTTTISMDSDTKHKDLNTGLNENICGYVTHKQLSEFGQRLQ